MHELLLRCLIVVTCTLAAGIGAHAQDRYPAKPVRLIVPLAAGGPTDTLARSVAQRLSERLQQPVVVDNKPGAEGLVAARDVIASAPDGYTLLFATGSMVAAPLRSRPPAFDWSNELAPVGRVGRVAFCLMVHPDVPARTVAELVAYARANPDTLNYGTNTLSELMAAAQFMQATGVRLTQVSYKGGAQSMPDLLAGRIQIMFAPVALALPHAASGKLRVLATLLPARSTLLPDVPTLTEAGYAGVEVPTWQAVFAPARTPRAAIDRLAAELAAALADPALRTELERRSIHLEPGTPAELAAVIAADQARWTALIAQYKLGAE
jgi:tripartite-type tricarboxylate transporter receptor subunit TctC